MFELRGYQKKLIDDTRAAMRDHKRVIMQLGTGGGKTYTFSFMASTALSKGKTVLIVTHRIELVYQTFSSISEFADGVRLLVQGTYLKPDEKCVVAMVETLNNRLKEGWAFKPDLVIIDECHFGNFKKIVEFFKDSYIIGVSATPVGKHLIDTYETIVQGAQISELQELGFLVEEKAYMMDDDLSDLKKSGGDFTEKSLYSHYDNSSLYKGVVDNYVKYLNGRPAMVFCVNKKHTISTCEEFKARGIPSNYILSGMRDSERDLIISEFKAGVTKVMVNCSILTTGFDSPFVEGIILNRATASLALFLQMVGRGSRPSRDTGKKRMTVLDFGKNYERFGFWSNNRQWSLTPTKKRDTEREAAVKTCPECEALVSISVKKCPYCGFMFPKTEKEIKEGVMVELKKEAKKSNGKKLSEVSVHEIVNLVKIEQISKNFAARVIRSKGDEQLKEYASLMGYKQSWVEYQKRVIDGSEFNDKKINVK